MAKYWYEKWGLEWDLSKLSVTGGHRYEFQPNVKFLNFDLTSRDFDKSELKVNDILVKSRTVQEWLWKSDNTSFRGCC